VGLTAGLDDMEKRKFLTLPGLELRPFGRSACSQYDTHVTVSKTKGADRVMLLFLTAEETCDMLESVFTCHWGINDYSYFRTAHVTTIDSQ
jgi:hypothetical protein